MTSSVGTLGSSQVQSEIQTVEARLEAPITQLNNQAATDKAEISAWGVIQGNVSSLSTALAGISNLSTLTNVAASTSVNTVATATVATGAQPGTYSLVVNKLAAVQEVQSSVVAASALTGSGALSITTKGGTAKSISIGSGSMTLSGISKAINAAHDGVQASIVNGSGGAHLVLQGSGSGGGFSISGTNALAKFTYSSANASSSTGGVTMKRTQAAASASATIDGITAKSPSNTFSTAIPDVTLTLAGTGSSTVTVSNSPAAIAGALSSVAGSLNAALSNIAKATAYIAPSSAAPSSAPKSGPLLGAFTATDMSNQMLTAISGAAASGMSAGGIGFSVSKTGAVAFSSATFATAYAQNPTAVQALVGQIYKSLDNVTTVALGGTGTNGTLGAETTSLQASVTSINAQVTQLTKNDAVQLNILSQQYQAAEAASAAAQTSAAYLSIFTSTGSGSSHG